jgi:autotransporter-associated beta strand protein
MNKMSHFRSTISKFRVRPALVCRSSIKAWVFVALTALTFSSGQAQTWDGGGLVAPWSNATNWVGDVAPVANNSLTFAGTTQLSTSNDYSAGTQFNGITFASGAGAFVLAGNSINLGGNVTNLSGSTVTISLPLVLLQDTSFHMPTSGGNITVSGVISGTGFDLIKTGASTLSLTGATVNSYTGVTQLREGGLSLQFNSAASNTVNLINSASALEMGGGAIGSASIGLTSKNTATSANSQTFSGTTIRTGTNTITLSRGTGAAAGNSMTLNLGAISRESGGFLQIVAGNLATLGSTVHVDGTRTLSNGIIGGWATYGGDWATISGGDVVAYTGYTVPAGTSPTIASSATSNVQITNTNALTAPSGVTNTSGTALVTMTSTAGLTAGDALSGAGVPAGATILSVDSATQITMSVNSRSAVSSLAVYRPVTLATSGTTDINTLQITDSNNRIINIGSGNTLRLGEVGGVWRNVAAIPDNNYGNRVTINGGTLTAGGAPNTAGEIVFNTGGGNTSTNNGTGSRINRGIVVNSVIANNGSGEVSLTKTGFEALQLGGANTYTGDTYVHRGILESTVANNLGGTGANVYAYAQSDSSGGQVILAGAGDYTNNFFINGNGTIVTPSSVSFNFGALAFGNTNATVSGDITLLGDSRIGRMNGVTDATQGFLISGKISGNYQLAFGTGSQQGGAYRLSNTANDWSGNTQLSISATSGESLDLWLGASNVLPDGTGKGNIVFNRGSTGSNQVRLNLNGFDETVNALVSTDSYTGVQPLNVQAGFRRVRNMSATTTSTLTVGSANTSGAFFGTIENGGTAVLNLVKTGTGTQELSGSSTYTGTTTVNSGTLLVSGTLTGTSAVTVNTGGNFNYTNAAALNRNVTINGGKFSHNSATNYAGTLTFTSGTVGGSNLSGLNLTIGANQTMSPGNSTGTLTSGVTTWANGGTFEWEINDATGSAGSITAGWDLANLTSLDVTAGVGQFTIEIVSLDALQAAGNALNFNPANEYTWLFIDAGSAVTGFAANKFVLDTSGFDNAFGGQFSISQGTGPDTDKLYINYSAIPEPSTYAMLIGGLGLLAFLRRRSKS